MSIIKAARNKLTQFSFELDVKGSIPKDSSVKANIVIVGENGVNLSVPCKKTATGSWSVDLPPMKEHVKGRRAKYNVEVIVDGWHFEPLSGDLIVEDAPTVAVKVKSTPKRESVEPDTTTTNVSARQSVASPGNALLAPEHDRTEDINGVTTVTGAAGSDTGPVAGDAVLPHVNISADGAEGEEEAEETVDPVKEALKEARRRTAMMEADRIRRAKQDAETKKIAERKLKEADLAKRAAKRPALLENLDTKPAKVDKAKEDRVKKILKSIGK